MEMGLRFPSDGARLRSLGSTWMRTLARAAAWLARLNLPPVQFDETDLCRSYSGFPPTVSIQVHGPVLQDTRNAIVSLFTAQATQQERRAALHLRWYAAPPANALFEI